MRASPRPANPNQNPSHNTSPDHDPHHSTFTLTRQPPSPEAPTGGSSFFSSLFGAPPTPSPTGSLDSLSPTFKPSVPNGSVMVLTQPQPPYAIVWASPGWLVVCGYSSLAEVAGRTLSIVQGARTERAVVDRIMEAVRYEQSVEGLRLINYDKQRRPFRHTLRVTPVRSRSVHDVSSRQ